MGGGGGSTASNRRKLMITRRSSLVYGTLVAIWVLLLAWQTAEHARVKESARDGLRHRAKDLSNAMGVVMKSVRFRGGGFILRERLQPALSDLIGQGDMQSELQSVELLNAAGEVMASAGVPIEPPLEGYLKNGEKWGDHSVIFENLVDLGTNNIVVSRNDFPPDRRPGTNAPPTVELSPPPPPVDSAITATNAGALTNLSGATGAGSNNGRGLGPRRRGPSEMELREMREKNRLHDFVIVMSTQVMREISNRDLWLRFVIGLLGTVSVAGYGLAWRSFGNTSELQIRLARASELNSHLKELNLAAAGLAHETRNPLNIIRGLAQMISKQQDASPEIRGKSRDIIDEADRVAAQLNEFINYSRPRELRRVPTNLASVIGEVVRALNYDVEEKQVRLVIEAERLVIEADEQLLRQALFNLVLNSIQAVPAGGAIQIRTGKRNGSGAFIEIADNGPGVPPENRSEIFKPYFTTNQTGTGLGLAVVQQIVAAHGWEIQCLPNDPAGARFLLSGLKLMLKG